MQELTYPLIEAAADVLRGVAHVTPVMTSRTLDALSGAQVFLKCENFQRGGSFKFRGACHAVTRLTAEKSISTFAAVSSGNHAQGIALACRLHGATALIVMPEPCSAIKHRAVLGYGATVHVAKNRPAADALVRGIATDTDAAIVHSFNDPLVMAGQGTIMMELLDQIPRLDTVLAPVGGGGLLSGLCVAAQARRPQMKIFACEPAGAMDAIESVRQNRIVPIPDPDTMADGLRTSLGDRTLPILRKGLAGFFVVQEQEIAAAMRFAYERLKLVIEPSSAVALVPLLRREPQLAGNRVAVVLTGGNVDLSLLSNCLSSVASSGVPKSSIFPRD